MTDRVVVLPRTDTERVEVRRSVFRSRETVDVRLWWLPDGANDWKASKKGVAFKLDQVPVLIRALQELSQ